MRLGQCHGHHHAFASRQAIGLDDDGRTLRIDVSMGRRSVGEFGVARGRDAMALHESLGVGLGAFQLRRSLGGPEDAQATRAKSVHHARSQRCFRADDGEGDLLRQREFHEFVHTGDRYVHQLRIERGAAIAGRDIHRLHPLALRQFPGQCVLAATTADHQNLHAALTRRARRCGTRPARRPGLPSRRAAFACVRRRHRRARWGSRRASSPRRSRA